MWFCAIQTGGYYLSAGTLSKRSAAGAGAAMDHAQYSVATTEDIVRLRRRIAQAGLPPRRTDANVIVGTWNIQKFGGFHPDWSENPGSPKRNLRALALIAEVVRCFDVIALQEVLRDTGALRYLMDQSLGPHWAVLLTDVSGGDKGNSERLAYLYDTRRVVLSGTCSPPRSATAASPPTACPSCSASPASPRRSCAREAAPDRAGRSP